MNRGHIPLRRCVGCRRVRPQGELLRLARVDGGWVLDSERRRPGRGSWVCTDTPACWTPKRLGRTYRAHTETICHALSEHFNRTEPQLKSQQNLQQNSPEPAPSTKPDRRA